MRNIFDQYNQPENKLTHSLISCLNEEKYLLKSFLDNFCLNFFKNNKNIRIEQQSIPGEINISYDENQRKGLPDSCIYSEDQCLIIECKVSSSLSKDQLVRHQKTIERRGFSDIRGLGIVVDLSPNVRLDNWSQITWNQIYCWAYKETSKSKWARILIDYFNVLESKMVEEEYLKEGSITEFTGIQFNDENPYTYREGKRQLKLLTNKIKKNVILENELNIDLSREGRGGIKKVGILWDYLVFHSDIVNKSFTNEPHLTIGLGDKFIEGDLTIPYRIKGKTKKNFTSLSWNEFKKIIHSIAYNYFNTFGISEGFQPRIVLAQRRYPSQSSPAINDARLEMDIRTAFDDISSKLKPKQKKQEEWLRLVYEINNNKKSNLQFQVGARFYYNDHSLVQNKDADEVLCKSFLACKPLIEQLFK